MAKKKSAAELKEEGAAINQQLTVARKRTVNFALQIGKEGLVLETDPKKAAEVLWRNCKKNGGGPKGAMGTMDVRGRLIELNCVDDSAPPQLPKMARKWLAERGQPFKVVMITPSGSIGDEDDDGEEALAQGMEEEEPAARQMEETGGAAPGSELMEGEEEEIQMTPSPDDTGEMHGDGGSGGGDAPIDPVGPKLAQPVELGAEPRKRDLSGAFGEVRKDLLKMMGQLEAPAQAAVTEQITRFGELMQSSDFRGAQKLMDDLSTAQGVVTDGQRSRARNDVAEIDGLVGEIEAELSALEAAMKQQESA